ncbi:MAG: translation initiation factor IF-2 [Candidatus Sericytochromatia bacterium]|nr:translation initiation factor IF-2 [Candidatus Sericytochromatia bacterium]
MSKKRISEVKKEISTLFGLDVDYPEIASMCRKLGIEFKEDSKFGIHYNAVVDGSVARQLVTGFKNDKSAALPSQASSTTPAAQTASAPTPAVDKSPARPAASSASPPREPQPQASSRPHQSASPPADVTQNSTRPPQSQSGGRFVPSQPYQNQGGGGRFVPSQPSPNQGGGGRFVPSQPSPNQGGGGRFTPTPPSQNQGGGGRFTPTPPSQNQGGGGRFTPTPPSQNQGGGGRFSPSSPSQGPGGGFRGQPSSHNRPGNYNRGGGGNSPGQSSPPRKSKTQMRQEKRREKQQFQERVELATPQEKKVELHQNITVSQLAEKMGIGASEVIKALFMKGVMTTINHILELETAEMVAHELGYEVIMPSATETPKEAHPHVRPAPAPANEDPAKLKPRPPIVTIMGHVDHGKTSLLDYIRKTKVTDAEVGGITQRIGAYLVHVDEKPIVFLDTPGHEAFTAMRARGAHVTDMAILVVAADDGIMPQTIEAINHARAAKVQIIVAINKMDKPGADPERVKQQLTEYALVPEEWGGDTVIVPVSAKSGDGVDDLLEMILLVAELMELKANPDKPAVGIVIESKLDKGRGAVGTVLIQGGTLRAGDSFVVGSVAGKVRAMTNERGKHLKKAGPSIPVEILGFQDVPEAGTQFQVVKNEKIAKALAEEYAEKQEIESRSRRISLSNLYENVKEGKIKELNVVLKADIHGSVDAIKQSLERLSDERIQLQIIHNATGEISEYDIMLASASNALVLGFNVKADNNAKRVAEREQIEIRYYDIIYKLIEDIEKAMEGLLEPEMIENTTGEAEVRAVFKVGKQATAIAGSYMKDGKCERSSRVRVWRKEEVVFTGKISSLKRFKDDVKEVASGYEFGVGVQNYNELEVGDRLEFFQVVARHEISKA